MDTSGYVVTPRTDGQGATGGAPPSGDASSAGSGGGYVVTRPGDDPGNASLPAVGGEQPSSAPAVTWGGLAAQAGRGMESGLYHLAGSLPDVAGQWWQSRGLGLQAAKDLVAGDWSKPADISMGSPTPVSDAVMSWFGQRSPQLDPRNYPPQNWAERIVRGAGDVGTQLAGGRLAVDIPSMRASIAQAPSSVAAARILANSARPVAGGFVAGAGAGAGGQAGREAASQAIDTFSPDFRQQNPRGAELIEDAGGLVGGGVGGWAGSGLASAARIPPGAAGVPPPSASTKGLLDTARGQYTTARNIPGAFTVPAVVQYFDNHKQDLLRNFGSSGTRPVITELNKLTNPPAGSYAVPASELHFLDDKLGDTVQAQTDNLGNLSNLGAAAAYTKTAIGNFLRNPPPQSIHSGDPMLAAQYWRTADGNWAAGKRSQTLDLAQQRKGELDRLTDPKYIQQRLEGFSQGEQDQLGAINKGWRLPQFGHGAEAGAGITAGVGTYMETGSPYAAIVAGAAPAVGGYATRKVNEFLTNRAIRQIAQQTRNRAPAAQPPPNLVYPPSQVPASTYSSWNQPRSPTWYRPGPPMWPSGTPASLGRTAAPVGLGMVRGLMSQ